jgi:hypothetical protein
MPGRPRRPRKPARGSGADAQLSPALRDLQKAIKRSTAVRRRVSQNPAHTPVNKSLQRSDRMPTADELFAQTTPGIGNLGIGHRAQGVTSARPADVLPSAQELYDETSDLTTVDLDTQRIWYITPHSIAPERPRARDAEYNADKQELRVVFREGGTYVYYGVPYQTAAALRDADSFGRTLDRLVINRFEYQKVVAS